MAAVLVAFAHDVEQEGVDVVVERLVVEEELRQQAEVLAVGAGGGAVDLEDRDRVGAVDLVPGRVHRVAPLHVARERLASLHKMQVELAKVERVAVGVALREGRVVPGLHLPAAEDDLVDVLDPRRRLVLALRRRVELASRRVMRVHGDDAGRGVELALAVAVAASRILVLAKREPLGRHPLVQPAVELYIVHVILRCSISRSAPLDHLAVAQVALAPLAAQALPDLEHVIRRLGLRLARVNHLLSRVLGCGGACRRGQKSY